MSKVAAEWSSGGLWDYKRRDFLSDKLRNFLGNGVKHNTRYGVHWSPPETQRANHANYVNCDGGQHIELEITTKRYLGFP